MSLETDLQSAISAASDLNQAVQGKIDEINTELDAAVADSQTRTTNSINSLTAAVGAELGNLRPYSMQMLFWKDLRALDGTESDANLIRIHPAMVIGQGWDDGDRNSYNQYGDKNNVVWDNETGGYRPLDANCVNPFMHYRGGVADEWSPTNANSDPNVVGTGIGTAYSPVLIDPTTDTPLTYTDADGNTQYYKCYHDFWTNDTWTSTTRTLNPAGDLTSISSRKAYLVMQGSVVGHPDRAAMTFVNVLKRSIGSYSDTHNYQRQDLNGDGVADTTVRNWARPRMARHASNDTFAGNPENGSDSYASTGLVAIQGQHYGTGSAYRNFSNITTRDLELEIESGTPTTVPAPYTAVRWNNYSAKWAIPIGDMPATSTPSLRVINWGYTGLIIEGWGIAIQSPVER